MKTGARGQRASVFPTGISNVSSATKNDGNIYDLQGRRVTKPTKGLFVVNGKKVVVKLNY
jgi:hypothetical protein